MAGMTALAGYKRVPCRQREAHVSKRLQHTGRNARTTQTGIAAVHAVNHER